MDLYDDRPISVYDNLNMPSATMHTSTPKTSKNQQQSHHTHTHHTHPHHPQQQTMGTTSTPIMTPESKLNMATSATALPNGTAISSPYNDISFKFNENNKPQQIQQQQQLHTSDINYRSLSPNHSSNQVQQTPNVIHYATTFKPTAQAAVTAPTQATTSTSALATATTTSSPLALSTSPPSQVLPATATPTTSTAAAAATTAPNAIFSQRPLSQHSQSQLHEASQSIAAVKAALNDAKSKFFGLNGYAQHQQQLERDELDAAATSESQNYNLLPLLDSQPKVQIVAANKPIPPPKPKPQPKYQNIPENSAIFRNRQHQPPELPPKPYQQQTQYADLSLPTSSSPSLPLSISTEAQSSPTLSASSTVSSHKSQNMDVNFPTATNTNISGLPTTINDNKLLPHANTTYKQIPLNDIDSSQHSQAVYMSTTVPQNIKGCKIGGRHTPTRNSLRHSRMLVVSNKNYNVVNHPNPMNFKHPIFARRLLILEIIIGLLISCLSIWIFFLAPNTAIQDNPYWSGLTLLIAGILGLILVRYQRIKRNKVRENCFLFLRADSYLVALLAVLLCCVALVCASIQFTRLTANDTSCQSTDPLLINGSCTCTFNAIITENDGESPAARQNGSTIGDEAIQNLLREETVREYDVDNSHKVEYRDLSCQELKSEWIYILGISVVLNALGFIVAFMYLLHLACCRNIAKRHYSSVHTSNF